MKQGGFQNYNMQRQDSEGVNQLNGGGNRASRKDSSGGNPLNYNQMDSFANIRWPTQLLSLVHPFNLDEVVDESLENFFGLCLPFLDFRIGVQGADESFSFVISKEDEEFYFNRNGTAKSINMLKLSIMKKEERNQDKQVGLKKVFAQ